MRKSLQVCRGCDRKFIQSKPYQTYCTESCKQSYINRIRESKRLPAKRCQHCGNNFLPDNIYHTYCSINCLPGYRLSNQQEESSLRKAKPRKLLWVDINDNKTYSAPLKGHYVYGWRIKGSREPFYVGHGMGRRAWEVHTVDGYGKWSGRVYANCQIRRAGHVEVIVFRQNLTKEGAMLGESIITASLEYLGIPLTNRAACLKRQEIPPLQLGK